MQTFLPNFYRPFDKNDFRYDRCFLCGNDNIEELTREHVFPKWLQHAFCLFNQELTLLNGSSIQYRQLTIPCCKECNGVHLSRMEQAFQALWKRRFSNLTDEDRKIIFQWTAKLLYGTLYKELSLAIDRKEPGTGNIMTPELIENYSTLHLFLQSIRIKTEFLTPVPWSLFAFRYADESYNYFNDISNLCLSIKLGNAGVTMVFEDNNHVEKRLKRLQGLYRFELSREMFYEVSARVFYTSRLILKAPFYISAYHEPTKSMQVVSQELPARDFNDEEFASFFAIILQAAGIELDRPMYENGKSATILFDKEHGAYIDLIIAEEENPKEQSPGNSD